MILPRTPPRAPLRTLHGIDAYNLFVEPAAGRLTTLAPCQDTFNDTAQDTTQSTYQDTSQNTSQDTSQGTAQSTSQDTSQGTSHGTSLDTSQASRNRCLQSFNQAHGKSSNQFNILATQPAKPPGIDAYNLLVKPTVGLSTTLKLWPDMSPRI